MAITINRHMQQSTEWTEFKKSLGKNIISNHGSGWHYNAYIERGDGRFGKYFKRLYCPYGPAAINNIAFKESLESLTSYGSNHDIDFVRIELTNNQSFVNIAKSYGFSKASRLSQPDLTLNIDLTQETESILSAMSKTNQYLWRKAPSNNLSFKISYLPSDLDPIGEMITQTAQRAGAIFHPLEYYKTLLNVLGPSKTAGVAYAYHNNEIIVGAIFFDDKEESTRYYMYGYSKDSARKLSANSPLLTYLILDAKNKGLKTFDMFGVSPADQPNHRWAGFSKFKRSFGGYEVAYGGTWEKPIKQVRYSALKFARKISK